MQKKNAQSIVSNPFTRPNPEYKTHPVQLEGKERGQYHVDALLDYNQGIIRDNPVGALAKFDKLTLSPFVFLRGTADLMYRDFDGTDADMAPVVCFGDVHLENYGVMEAGKRFIWGFNDFDEASFAPFSWEVKRGAVSVALAALQNGFDTGQQTKLVHTFVKGYIRTIDRLARGKEKPRAGLTAKNAPPLIAKILKKSAKKDGLAWLAKKCRDETMTEFLPTDEMQPLPDKKPVIQKAIDAYQKNLPDPPDKIVVLDVAAKTGSGTGSVGLYRYYALVESHRGRKATKLILELKTERPSALTPYICNSPLLFSSDAARVVMAQKIFLPDANPWYGEAKLDGASYLVRERSPHKARVDLVKLTKFKDFEQYTAACGEELAYAHNNTDNALDNPTRSTAQRILKNVHKPTCAEDTTHYVMFLAGKVIEDWKHFKKVYRKRRDELASRL